MSSTSLRGIGGGDVLDDVWFMVFQIVDEMRRRPDYHYVGRKETLEPLSLTCRRFRAFAAPHLFRRLTWENLKALRDYLDFVQHTPTTIPDHVREVRFMQIEFPLLQEAAGEGEKPSIPLLSGELAALTDRIGLRVQKVDVDLRMLQETELKEALSGLFHCAKEVTIFNDGTSSQSGILDRFLQAGTALTKVVLFSPSCTDPFKPDSLPCTLRNLSIHMRLTPAQCALLLAHAPALESLDIGFEYANDEVDGSFELLSGAISALGQHLRSLALHAFPNSKDLETLSSWADGVVQVLHACSSLTHVDLCCTDVDARLVEALAHLRLSEAFLYGVGWPALSPGGETSFARLCEAVLELPLEPRVLKRFVIFHCFGETTALRNEEIEQQLRAKVPEADIRFRCRVA